jgi:hypothetical protein
MNIFFIDDSKEYMESFFLSQQSDGNILFLDMLKSGMKPITIFFGNYENEYKTFKPIGMPELEEYLDNLAEKLFNNGYKPSEDSLSKYISKDSNFDIDVDESAFLLYDNDDPVLKTILEKWDDEIKKKLIYKNGKYESDEINNFLIKIDEKISNNKDKIVLIDMLLVIDDHDRFGDEKDMQNIPDKPILSMIIYHYLKKKSIKCAVFSSYSKWENFNKKWVPIYNKFFIDDQLIEENDNFIINRKDLSVKIIKNIAG